MKASINSNSYLLITHGELDLERNMKVWGGTVETPNKYVHGCFIEIDVICFHFCFQAWE